MGSLILVSLSTSDLLKNIRLVLKKKYFQGGFGFTNKNLIFNEKIRL